MIKGNGQVLLIGEQDKGYQNWSKVMNRIRAYAQQHARRHFVLLNAHTHGMLDESGRLMFDFHCYPIRPVAVTEDTPYHAPDGVHPQRCKLIMGWGNSIFGRSMGGVTHSGWKTASLPYFVEIDNYGCQPPALLNTPVDYYPWGYDECSWFAQQPKAYRAEWLQYAHDWIREKDPAGALEMPGLRGISIYDKSVEGKLRRSRYFIADPAYDDCDAVRSIWCAERENAASLQRGGGVCQCGPLYRQTLSGEREGSIMIRCDRYDKNVIEPYALSTIAYSYDLSYKNYSRPKNTDNFDYISQDGKRALEISLVISENEREAYIYDKELNNKKDPNLSPSRKNRQ